MPSVHTFSTRGEFRQEKKCRRKKKKEKEGEWLTLGSRSLIFLLRHGNFMGDEIMDRVKSK